MEKFLILALRLVAFAGATNRLGVDLRTKSDAFITNENTALRCAT
jgi:hypothetical protein